MNLLKEYRRQVHYTDGKWDGALVDSHLIIDVPISTFKPLWGFWTSSHLGADRSAWRNISKSRRRNDKPFHFEVVGDPRVLTLVTDQDVDRVLAEYGVEKYTMDMMIGDIGKTPPLEAYGRHQENSREYLRVWKALSEAYDAVRVPDYFDRSGELRYWDCESTVWFKPATFLKRIVVAELVLGVE